ncbi:hypothetical protein PybrP1_009657 [[Pythium] brassicae (nom. inval.)]|nr:hypothetical protein PybrP1_009657 [[Pythium] brassicae (nom. inval.)]
MHHAARGKSYEIVWHQHPLGLEFTPNERDEPVICRVPPRASPDVLQSPAAVGDVLVGFQLRGAAVERVTGFRQALKLLQRAELPVALRFVSRNEELPEPVAAGDVAKTYTFTWQATQPLGVSLAMDPCSLHTAITRIDAAKLAPDFQRLEPQVGDVLVSARSSASEGRSVQLDRLRFEDIIARLRELPRPAQLTFARLLEDPDVVPAVPAPATGRSPPASPSHASAPRAPPRTQQHPRLRPAPFASRQSFRIEKPVPVRLQDAPVPRQQQQQQQPTRPRGSTGTDLKSSETKFYKVLYSGGAIGLQLRDCSKEDSDKDKKSKPVNKTKTKGYSVCVKEVTDARSAPGLENASAGDLLMAIGPQDLQFRSFDHVHRDLAAIRAPTELLFKKRALSGSSSGSLVDTLFLFLI